MPPEPTPEVCLRRTRNRCAYGALLLLLASAAICWPAVLQRRRAIQAANQQLLALQAEIVALQQHTLEDEAEILKVQGEIRELSKQSR